MHRKIVINHRICEIYSRGADVTKMNVATDCR